MHPPFFCKKQPPGGLTTVRKQWYNAIVKKTVNRKKTL